MLSTCLALVKPVGMSAEDAQAWLRVAAGELAHLPPELLERGCALARKTCSYHGQIVPTITKETEEEYQAMKSCAQYEARQASKAQALPKPEAWVPVDGELERIKAEVARALKAN